MSLILSKYAKGLIALPYPSAADDATGVRFSHTFTTAPALGDILELGVIPAGCRAIDIIFDGDDLDTDAAPAIVADVGIMSGAFGSEDDTRMCGAEFFSGSTLLQSGGVERPTLKSAYRTTKSSTDRGIGVKFTTAPATFAAGTIGLTVIVAFRFPGMKIGPAHFRMDDRHKIGPSHAGYTCCVGDREAFEAYAKSTKGVTHG